MFKRIPTPVIYTVAGTGLSALTGIGGYFLGVRRTRAKFFGQMAVENLVLTGESASQGEFDFMGKLPVKEGIDEIMRKYGPHYDPAKEHFYDRMQDNFDRAMTDIADFERVATPLADEILAKQPGDSEEWSDQEIEFIRYMNQQANDEVLGKIELVEPLDTEEYMEPIEPEIHNVFAASSSDGNWDIAEELLSRTPERPYVIHQDEFIERDSGFDQSTLTYFAGDGVVVDELNEQLQDWVSTLGQLKFGHGTTDTNAVYIRNEKLQHEFEVLLSSGSYLDEVIGQEAELEIEHDEIKHSMNMRMRQE